MEGAKPSLTEEQLSMLASSIDKGIPWMMVTLEDLKQKTWYNLSKKNLGKHLRHDIVGIS